MKAELRGLPAELAERVGPHVLAAGELMDIDPQLAFRHAMVARRLASRLPIVREAAAETAYAAEEFATALSEYRALRRMNGGSEYLPVMADCERALGRPEEALKLADQARTEGLDATAAIEMGIVEAGARADMGQAAEARRLLKQQIQSSKNDRRVGAAEAARLRYAYADLLLTAGEPAAGRDWFAAAAALDAEGVTDADERLAQLDGRGELVIEFDESEDEDAATDGAATEDAAGDGRPVADGPEDYNGAEVNREGHDTTSADSGDVAELPDGSKPGARDADE